MMNSRHFLLVALVLVSVIYFQAGQSSDCPRDYKLIDKYDDEPSEWKNALFYTILNRSK